MILILRFILGFWDSFSEEGMGILGAGGWRNSSMMQSYKRKNVTILYQA